MVANVIVDILNNNVDRVFDYDCNGLDVEVGSRVLVPFANRIVEGLVLAIKDSSSYSGVLKKIIKVLDPKPPITKEFIQLTKRLTCDRNYLMAEVLRLFIVSEMRGGKVKSKTKRYICLAPDYKQNLNKIRKNATIEKEVVQKLETYGTLASLDFPTATLNNLEKKGIIIFKLQDVNRKPYENIENTRKNFVLTKEQVLAIDKIQSSNKHCLLFGVTGSGKTEVYVELIKNSLSSGKTAILLAPEIALTPSLLARFRSEFADKVAILHSGLSQGERFDEWWRIRNGEAQIVVGARSAIFAPLENVGIIIIDEEHESSYQSENSPRYNTFDIAKFRAGYNNAKLVIASATPLVESFYLTESNEFELVELKHRINKQKLPTVEIVDMKREKRKGNNTIFSRRLLSELGDVLAKNQQALLFINRRGYAPHIICSDCGFAAKCPNCDISLVFHSDENLLKCHYCGSKFAALDLCPNCDSSNIIMNGIGTQKVCIELQKLFPNARILRMDNDTTRQKEGHHKIINEFTQHKADILVGTQMIAKGHNFPLVTLVGILDADMSLYMSDYKSFERTFSLITQVAGRAGRAENEGKVILQTYSPNHSVYKLISSYDYYKFYKSEIALREATHYPPFADIIRVMFVGENEEQVLAELKSIYEKMQTLKNEYPGDFFFMNCSKSPIRKINNKYRYQILMRIKRKETLLTSIHHICEKGEVGKVAIYVQINP